MHLNNKKEEKYIYIKRKKEQNKNYKRDEDITKTIDREGGRNLKGLHEEQSKSKGKKQPCIMLHRDWSLLSDMNIIVIIKTIIRRAHCIYI